jgi:hypothetical protein
LNVWVLLLRMKQMFSNGFHRLPDGALVPVHWWFRQAIIT